MSIFRKDSSSPPGGAEHPGPKLTLLKSHHQAVTGGGIAIRFNASSSFDDDDESGQGITVMTTETPASTAADGGGGSAVVINSGNNRSQISGGRNVRVEGQYQQQHQHGTEQQQNGGRQGGATGGERQSQQDHTRIAAGLNNSNSSVIRSAAPTSKLPLAQDMDHKPGITAGLLAGNNEDRNQPLQKSKEQSRIYARSQDGEEKVSILSGIRGRLQDKFHDNLTAVIGKIEEISGDSKLGEALERRLKKGDSFDSSRGTSHQSKTNGSGTSVKRVESEKKSREGSRSRHNSGSSYATNEAFETCDGLAVSSSHSSEVVGPLATGSATSLPGVVGKEDLSAQEEEVFTESAVVDEKVRKLQRKPAQQQQRPSSTSGVETISDTARFSMKSWKQKDGSMQMSSLESSQSVPVSMSALLSHTDADLEEEEEVGIECDQEFFDLQEGRAKKSGNQEHVNDSGGSEVEVDKKLTPVEKTTDHTTKFKLPFNIACTRNNVLSTAVALLAIFVLPLPSFVSGILIGGFLGACTLSVFQWVTQPLKPKEPTDIPDIRKQPPLRVPYMIESKNEDGKFKGWMNELPFYDTSTYHISNTKSVYIQLEGSDLRLQTPKQGIPKRALWTEPKVFPTSFIKQRFLNLTECTVSLLPEGLVSKRIWSKKYPICIMYKRKESKTNKKPAVAGEHMTMSGEDLEEAKHLGFDGLSGELASSGSNKGVYLFARTCREKEEWFHRLVAASLNKPLFTSLSDLITKANSHCMMHKSSSAALLSSMETGGQRTKHQQHRQQHQQQQRRGSSDSTHSETFSNIELELLDNSEKVTLEYIQYMTQLMPNMKPLPSPCHRQKKKSEKSETTSSQEGGGGGFVSLTNSVECDPTVLWTNALLGRLFFDFLREQYWADKVRAKIQGKLSKIHVPYFIDKLTVTGIELGSQVPVIQRISRPYLDERGIWFDLDIVYSGGFSMTLETKVNLMKLKKNSDVLERKQHSVGVETHKASAVTDSGEEDSAESSTDEEAEEEYTEERLVQAEPARKKLLKIVDKIAASKYFQQATENKYIKKAMEGVSNTRLVLSVEMKSCVGTMVLNIPPPPTDRIWYGFRKNPTLVLSAKPRVGQREVSMAHIVEWIENKLALEFQRVVVLPNMDDLEIPLMCGHLSNQTDQGEPGEGQNQEEWEAGQQQEQLDRVDTSLLTDTDLD